MKRIFLILIACALVAACKTNTSKVQEKNKEIIENTRFNEPDKPSREAVAIQRLKDIRTLQEAHKNVKGYYATTMDSLKIFYNEGLMKVVLQVGSKDDSLAVANTAALEKKLKVLKQHKGVVKTHTLFSLMECKFRPTILPAKEDQENAGK